MEARQLPPSTPSDLQKYEATFVKVIRTEAKRDILNFVTLRLAHEGDDITIGDLLTRAFTATYEKKLPEVATPYQRLSELRGVADRRRAGAVYALELGYRAIGSVALIRPNSAYSQAWLPATANLRCLAIDPDFHGLGLTEPLLAASEQLTQSWGFDQICLHVQKGAAGIARLYESRGYERCPEGDLETNGAVVEAYLLHLNRQLS
jgi:GNAT superfamily N-acetyltransferase